MDHFGVKIIICHDCQKYTHKSEWRITWHELAIPKTEIGPNVVLAVVVPQM